MSSGAMLPRAGSRQVVAAVEAGHPEVAGILLEALSARDSTAAAALTGLAAAEGALPWSEPLLKAWLEYEAVIRALQAQQAPTLQV
jgi:hypothetical protein